MVNLRHLETFVIVAEELHFGRAAQRLHVAQPAVSQTIRALESEIGVDLFDRSGRRVRLTDAGRAYVADAHDVLDRLSRATTRAVDAQAGFRGRISIGYTAASALDGLADVVAAYQRLYPDVQVELEHCGTADQAERIRGQTLDVGFGILPGGPEPVHSEVVVQGDLSAFVATSHGLHQSDRVPIAAVLRERLIVMSRSREPCVHQLLNRLGAEHQIVPDIALEVDHLETLLSFVAAGIGVGLAPSAAGRLRLDGVTTLRLDPAIPAGMSMMWNPAATSPTTTRFLDVTRATLGRPATPPAT